MPSPESAGTTKASTSSYARSFRCSSVYFSADRVSLQVVHGAGSFGHFDAREYGVSTGGNLAGSQHLAIGCSKTRRSVTRLNNDLLGALIDAGLPAVGISAFPHCVCRGGSKLEAAGQVLEMADQVMSKKQCHVVCRTPTCHVVCVYILNANRVKQIWSKSF